MENYPSGVHQSHFFLESHLGIQSIFDFFEYSLFIYLFIGICQTKSQKGLDHVGSLNTALIISKNNP